ncbi:MAG: ATP synthase subunit delta, sodium ion specific [Planctomycetes bacterium]|nr:ATP synthase subunit delta, sodium ion specific [Planctomycetota bacterium]
MPNTSDPVARVYAAALIELGREQGSLPQIYDDLHAVERIYSGDEWFRQFFTSPRIDRAVKWKAVEKAFRGKIGRPVMGLLKVLIEKGREPVYDNVVGQFDRFKDLAENRVHAFLVTAAAVEPDFRASLVARLESASGRKVALHERVDPACLGGASLRIGDKVIDRTLRTRLAALRRRLTADNMETTKR